jgi:hypothetical protein
MESLLLGPLGRLMKIDVPSGGYQSDLVEYGAEHVPLSGRRTKDVFSRRLEYQIDTDGLTPRALSWFEMLYTGAEAGPLYLRESSRKNLLRARISSTGAAPIALNASGTDWSAVGAGDTVTIVAATNQLLPGTVPGGELMPGPSNAVSYFANATNRVMADTAIVPVAPGEKLFFSVYKQSGGTPTLEIVPYSAALVAGAPATGTTTIASTPNRLFVSYTVPSTGVAAVSVQIRAATSATYVTQAWMLESVKDLTATTPTTWHLGAGVPQVLMLDSISAKRHGVGAYADASYVFKEV